MISDDFWGWDISLEVGHLCENAKKPEKNDIFEIWVFFSRGFSGFIEIIKEWNGIKVSNNYN